MRKRKGSTDLPFEQRTVMISSSTEQLSPELKELPDISQSSTTASTGPQKDLTYFAADMRFSYSLEVSCDLLKNCRGPSWNLIGGRAANMLMVMESKPLDSSSGMGSISDEDEESAYLTTYKSAKVNKLMERFW